MYMTEISLIVALNNQFNSTREQRLYKIRFISVQKDVRTEKINTIGFHCNADYLLEHLSNKNQKMLSTGNSVIFYDAIVSVFATVKRFIVTWYEI